MSYAEFSGSGNDTIGEEYDLPYSTWVVYESFSVMLMAISFYIFVMLLRYNCIYDVKTIAARQRNNGREDSSSSGVLSTRASVRPSKRNKRNRDTTGLIGRPLEILCLLGAFFALLRVSGDQLELATYGGPRVNCKVYQVFVVVTYVLSASCLYIALWIRLRVFYSHPIMKNVVSILAEVLVWGTLACIVASVVINITMFLGTVTIVDSSGGCIEQSAAMISPAVRYVILVLSTFFSQLLLLALFLYPLVKHHLNLKVTHTSSASLTPSKGDEKRSRICSNSDSIKNSDAAWNKRQRNFRQARTARRERRLYAIIWRVLLMAIVCLVSDVIAAVVTISLNDFPRIVSNLVFNCNIIVNVVSVLMSFGDWIDRMIPCCFCAKPPPGKKEPSHESSAFSKKSTAIVTTTIAKDSPQNGKWRGRIESSPADPFESFSPSFSMRDSQGDGYPV